MLQLYIMVDAAVHWFNPLSSIDYQGTQNSLQNDVDDDSVGNTATTDVMIAPVNENAAALMTMMTMTMTGTHLWQLLRQ